MSKTSVTTPETRGAQLEPRTALQIFYLASAAIALALWAFPVLNARLYAYGARVSAQSPDNKKVDTAPAKQSSKPTPNHDNNTLLDFFANLRVPHSYFTHFYITSVSCSIFWGYQLYTRGVVFRALTNATYFSSATPSMSLQQITIVWSLMLIQGIRRLYESYAFAKPSKSSMHSSIWIVGCLFYMADGMAVWIEGIPALANPSNSPPIMANLPAITLFAVSSLVQHLAHAHLYTLRTYTIPSAPLFESVLCPHYTAEVGIYVSLMLLGAPEGAWINQTLATAMVFVAANLAGTADGTKSWYIEKFGADKVGDRARMIPSVW